MATHPRRGSARLPLLLGSALLLVVTATWASGEDAPAERRHPLWPTWDLSPHEKRYSQFNEELIVRHFFGDERGGVFVDVGCSHWKKHSTTYFLEAHLGWSGVGIDALPKLAAGYERNRPHTRFLNYIVTDHSGGVETLYVGGPVSSTAEGHVEQWVAENPREPIEVPAITLDDALDQAGIAHIDFLSMDIEGGEAKALAGFDIARFRPRLVGIEVTETNEAAVSGYFEQHGYTLLERYRPYDLLNRYYARE
jgi:FkbM family methyltransferase